jgi:hypothetical protein
MTPAKLNRENVAPLPRLLVGAVLLDDPDHRRRGAGGSSVAWRDRGARASLTFCLPISPR